MVETTRATSCCHCPTSIRFLFITECVRLHVFLLVCALETIRLRRCVCLCLRLRTYTHVRLCEATNLPSCLHLQPRGLRQRPRKRKRAGARVELKEPRGKMWLCVEASEAFYTPQREGALGVSQGSRSWEGTRAVVILVSGSRPAAGLGSVRGRRREKGSYSYCSFLLSPLSLSLFPVQLL